MGGGGFSPYPYFDWSETQMAEKNNSVCKICGKPYYVCMSCASAMKSHPWKVFTDTANCYKVFQIVRGLSTGVYDKNEAKSRFLVVDLSELDTFRPHIKTIIEDVLTEPDTVKVDEKPVVEEDVQVEPTAMVAEEVIETTEAEYEKPVYSRKKNFKVETDAE